LGYFILDLERTLTRGVPYFWKRNRHGYTHLIEFAGLFPAGEAAEIVRQDRDKRTVMIEEKVVADILGKDMKPNESIT
jgi:hypothetical protein